MPRFRGPAGAISVAIVLTMAGGVLAGAGVTAGLYEADAFRGSGATSSSSRHTSASESSTTADFPRIDALVFSGGSGYEYDSLGPPAECAALGEPAGRGLAIAVFARTGIGGPPRVTIRVGGKSLSTVSAETFAPLPIVGPHTTAWWVLLEIPAGTISPRTKAPLEATVTARDKAGRTAEDTATDTLRSCSPLPTLVTSPSSPKSPKSPSVVTSTTLACNPNDPSSPGFPCV